MALRAARTSRSEGGLESALATVVRVAYEQGSCANGRVLFLARSPEPHLAQRELEDLAHDAYIGPDANGRLVGRAASAACLVHPRGE